MAVNPHDDIFCLRQEQESSELSALDGSSLSAAGLVKRFGSITAVRGVSLKLAPGKALGLLGPNGAGKSTTMLLLAGVLEPDEGAVDISGVGAPTRAAARRMVGYAPQAIALYPGLTARENLVLFARLYGLSRKDLSKRVSAALELAQLSPRADQKVRTFSGGMQRRLNLAAAIVHGPSVLLLDEPTVGVDPQSRAHLFSCIETLKQEGMSIVYSTHYLEEAERLCDTIAIMDNGAILAAGTRDELVSRFGGAARVKASMQRAPDDPSLAKHWVNGKLELCTDKPTGLVYQLLTNHRDVTELSMRHPSLESVFMNLTGRQLREC